MRRGLTRAMRCNAHNVPTSVVLSSRNKLFSRRVCIFSVHHFVTLKSNTFFIGSDGSSLAVGSNQSLRYIRLHHFLRLDREFFCLSTSSCSTILCCLASPVKAHWQLGQPTGTEKKYIWFPFTPHISLYLHYQQQDTKMLYLGLT